MFFGLAVLGSAAILVAAEQSPSGKGVSAQAASVAPPATIMTKPGKLLVSEDFSASLPPPEGSVARFASGFKGWRFNVEKRGFVELNMQITIIQPRRP
jgi:hypothetical protein